MTQELLHPGLGSGALREALEGLVAELQALADRTYAPGGPGHEEFEKGLRTAYLIAAGRVQKLLSLSSPIEPDLNDDILLLDDELAIARDAGAPFERRAELIEKAFLRVRALAPSRQGAAKRVEG